MFNLNLKCIAISVSLTYTILAAATPTVFKSVSADTDTCSVGTLLCCQIIDTALPSPLSPIIGILSSSQITIDPSILPIGVNCSPVEVSTV